MITTVLAPRINTNDDKVEVVNWHVAAGAFVEAGADVVDMETSKAVVTVAADAAGFVRPLVEKGKVMLVGDPLYLLASTAEELAAAATAPTIAPVATPAKKTESTATQRKGEYAGTRFSREAERLMQERGLSPADFSDAGLVTARSITGHASAPAAASKQVQHSARVAAPAFSPVPLTPRRELVSGAKRAEIQALSQGESGNINSMLSVYFDSEGIRARLQAEQSFDGNIQPLILFEISRLLKKWPQFTAFFDDDGIHYYDRIDLGVAVDLGSGLKVVTIKDADKLMPIAFFEKTIEIGLRYMENRLQADELVGSTLTVTDLSGFDVLHFHPLINGRQSAIIGLGGDSTLPGHPMSVSMTFDHRVSNGREVATFLGELRARLLSYALQDENAESTSFAEPEFAGSAASDPSGLPATATATRHCDACGLGGENYSREFGKNAYLLAYFRDDGTLGAVCHRCFDGWV